MCRLFAVSSKNDIYLNDYLKLFYAGSKYHPHGWGLAFLQDGEWITEKEPIKASDSNYLKERLAHPIVSKTALAHIRYATIGNIDRPNCHPYKKRDRSGRRWTLIHNGTIFEYEPLKKYIGVQKGETDSERILLYIVDKINAALELAGRALNFKKRFEIINEMVCDMSSGNKLNLILYDGEYLYVHTNTEGTLHYLKKDSAVYFSTEPLNDEPWQPVKQRTLAAYRAGEMICEGTTHDNAYIEDEDKLRLLYLIFSNL